MKKDNEKTISCKFGCGAVFPVSGKGRTDYMRHCKYDCPMSPAVKRRKEKAKKVKKKKLTSSEKEQNLEYVSLAELGKELTEEELLSEKKNLDTIIAEASMTRKRPSIVRMVEHVLNDPEKSIKVLDEALRIADIDRSQRGLIVRNWASHLEVADLDEILKKEKKIDVEEEAEKKTSVDPVKEVLKKYKARKAKHLEDLMATKEIADMEKELSGEKKGGEEKHTLVVDGVSLKLTTEEMLSWKRYLADEKRAEEEREERKQRESELKTHKGDDLVEWVIGENKEAKTVKVRPETIPMLIQSQSQHGKSGESDVLKMMQEEIKQMREDAKTRDAQFHELQTNILQKDINELKALSAIDPIDRLFEHKEKWEKLGMFSSAKATAQDKMYSMEGKKLDTMLSITMDKSKSLEKKIDTLVDVFGPIAKDYVREAVITMKKQRGETGAEVPYTEEEKKKILSNLNEDALESLEEIEKALSKPAEEEPKGPPKVIVIERTKKEPETAKKEG